MSKSLFIKSFGCQMNVYDSGRMADVLAPSGYDPVSDAAEADVVILNTCHIREKAAEKVYSDLGRLRLLKDRRRAAGRPLVLAVAGCVAQAEGEEMIRRAPQIDIVLGPQTYHRLPDMVARARAGERAIVATDFPVEEKFDHLAAVSPAPSAGAFLTIQEGCDRFCTFCVVPYTRGRRVLASGDGGAGRSEAPGRRRGLRVDAAGPERKRLSRCGRQGGGDAGAIVGPPGRDSGPRPASLHHLPSARRDRGADCRSP